MRQNIYLSKPLTWWQKYFGKIFTIISLSSLASFMIGYSVLIIQNNRFELTDIFFSLVSSVIGWLIYYFFYDYRNNLTRYEIWDDEIVLFNHRISWDKIKYIYNPFALNSDLIIIFNLQEDIFSALIRNEKIDGIFTSEIIEKKVRKVNPSFQKNNTIPVEYLFWCRSN